MVGSELGEIPKGWEVIRLSNIIEIIGGGTPKRAFESYWDGKYSLVFNSRHNFPTNNY